MKLYLFFKVLSWKLQKFTFERKAWLNINLFNAHFIQIIDLKNSGMRKYNFSINNAPD